MHTRFHIPNARPNEQLVFLLRRHPVTFLQHAAHFILLALAPLVAGAFVRGVIWPLIVDRDPVGVVIVLAGCVYYLFTLLLFFHAWLLYYLDVWIVTNERIIDIAQHNLFARSIAELNLENVQDVTAEVHGVLPTMLKFGDVFVQTAGEQPRFLCDDVPNPYEVARRITELHRVRMHTNHDRP